MSKHTSALVAFGTLVLGLVLTATLGASGSLHTNHLTFSGPVALPGLTLPGGTYIFERVVASNPDVVVVRSLDRGKVFFMATTQPTLRPARVNGNRAVVFGESRRGLPPPIRAWYPVGEERGHAFVY